jgi:uncharacterized integral membrane protein
MRAFGSFILWLLALLIVVVLVIFAIENVAPVSAHFLGYGFTTALWGIVAACAVLGFVLALLLMTPGRLSAGWRARSLSRSHAQTERELAALQERHAQLRIEHDQLAASHTGLQAERDQLATQREQDLQAQRERDQQAAAQAVAAQRTDTAADMPRQRVGPYVRETSRADRADRVDRVDRADRADQVDRTDQTAPADQTYQTDGAERTAPADQTDTTASSDRPPFGERLRNAFRGPDSSDQRNAETYDPYDQPPAPTA